MFNEQLVVPVIVLVIASCVYIINATLVRCHVIVYLKIWYLIVKYQEYHG